MPEKPTPTNKAISEALIIDRLVQGTAEALGYGGIESSLSTENRRHILDLLIATGRVKEVLSKARKLSNESPPKHPPV